MKADVTVHEMPGAARGNVADVERRLAITGPCSVRFEDGLRRLFEAHHATA